MALTAQQANFVNQLTYAAEKVSAGLEECIRLVEIYEDFAASSNPPSDADVQEHIGFGLSEIADFVAAVNAFVAVRDNQVPTPGDWGAALNMVRSL